MHAKLPSKIKKRDSSFTKFNKNKIHNAIFKASFEVVKDKDKADKIVKIISEKALSKISQVYKKEIPSVENVQDIIENLLMSEGYNHIAKSYILYREHRKKLRMAKLIYGIKDDLKLPLNTMQVLNRRYLLKDSKQNIIETPSELFRRVASYIAKAEENFKSSKRKLEIEEQFYYMMRDLKFLPNSPTLMNSGTSLGQLSACFVIPVEDSIEGIFNAVSNMAKIHQTGGGTGFSFSNLRPKGDLVNSTKGSASGPVSFMKIFNEATGVIVQGGRRRGANMGLLRCDHPDIIEFIEAKLNKDAFTNFNLSVGITDKFMNALFKNSKFDLINPRNKKRVSSIKAKVIFDLIVTSAWRTGDPGVIFLDEINKRNPTPSLGSIEATNPCGELPLLPYESCNLGAINLSKVVNKGEINWKQLGKYVKWGIRFLDNVIEVNKFPLPQIENMTRTNRKIGLGVMGFADMLIKLGISYNSKKAVLVAKNVMKFIRDKSIEASCKLARERGVFQNYKKSIYVKKKLKLRNATLNAIAPTGSISIIANCSSGIEPLFAISYVRNVLSNSKLFEINPLFQQAIRDRNLYENQLIAEVAKTGSIQKLKKIPKDIKRIFVTAFDINPRQHLYIQSAFQSYTDNSVSKTINLPENASIENVRNIYLLAYKLKCKGITVYRYGSKSNQVLTFNKESIDKRREFYPLVTADSEYSGGCLSDVCIF